MFVNILGSDHLILLMRGWKNSGGVRPKTGVELLRDITEMYFSHHQNKRVILNSWSQ